MCKMLFSTTRLYNKNFITLNVEFIKIGTRVKSILKIILLQICTVQMGLTAYNVCSFAFSSFCFDLKCFLPDL